MRGKVGTAGFSEASRAVVSSHASAAFASSTATSSAVNYRYLASSNHGRSIGISGPLRQQNSCFRRRISSRYLAGWR
jgi:hypothetical protein